MTPSPPQSSANQHLARALAGIVQQHGKGIIDDPDRLTSALRDYSGGEGRGVYVLLSALAEGVPQRLTGSKRSVPPEVVRANLVRNLHINRGIDMEQAAWAVQTWATALGLPFAAVETEVKIAQGESPRVQPVEQTLSGRTCPFCGAPVHSQLCGSCGRDATAPRKVCATCKKMVPLTDKQCWNCGTTFRSDLWWIVPLIVVLFIGAIVLSVVIRNL